MQTTEVRRLSGRALDILRVGAPGDLVKSARTKVAALVQSPIRRRQYRGRTFGYRGERLPYFIHSYSATWNNERIVEIPVAERFLRGRRHQRGLEVGNVLNHYSPRTAHTVVDKYERAPGVLNVDVIEFRPAERFDWIVSISTIEHVGWDENPREPGKAAKSIEHLRGLLTAAGRLLVTIPRGYNPELDHYMTSADPVSQTFLTRTGHDWGEEDPRSAVARTPDFWPFATCVWCAEFGPLNARACP